MRNFKINSSRIWGAIFFLFLFSACSDDSGETIVGAKPIADAGPDLTAEVGQTVTLDGSGSSDADGDALTYQWEFVNSPATSTASLSGSTSAITTFVPDVAGSYTARLSVNDGNNSVVTDEAIITVSEPSGAIEINGDINADTSWEDVFSDDRPDYHITAAIDINAVLTIMPGVIIQVDQNLPLVVTSNGAIIANGESGNKITITSSNVAGNIKWKGIYVNSGDQRNVLNHVTIEHGGSDDFVYIYNNINAYVPANISIADDAKLSISNSTVSQSAAAGIVAKPDAEILAFDNVVVNDNSTYAMLIAPNMIEMVDGSSSFSNNGTNGVAFYEGNLNNGTESSWSALSNNISYYGLGDLSVNNLLTLQEGVQILMKEDQFISIENDGGLIASGTVNNKILLSAINASNGLRWGGLYINSGDSRNSLNHVNVEYGGGEQMDYVYVGINNYVSANVFVDDNAILSIENSTINNSAEYGLIVQNGGDLGSFSTNSFEQNESYAAMMGIDVVPQLDGNSLFDANNINAVRVFQSTISQNATLPKLDNSGYYRVAADIDIAADIAVEAGATFHFDEDVFIDVNSSGSFSAIGTSSSHITFTSSNTAGNIHWAGLYIESGSSLNELNYVDIAYGGGDDMFYFYGSYNQYINTNIGLTANAQLTINNCNITNSDGYGVAIKENGTINSSTLNTPNNIQNVTSVNAFSAIANQNVAFED